MYCSCVLDFTSAIVNDDRSNFLYLGAIYITVYSKIAATCIAVLLCSD